MHFLHGHKGTLSVLARCLSLILLTFVHTLGLNISSIPKYCINPDVLQIFQSRIDKCLATHSPKEELHYLQQTSVSHFQAAQELVAYQYFINTRNPHRRACDDGAELEYIPFLPLAWKVGFPTRTSCTAGGVCPRHPLTHPHCDVKYLIEDILTYVKYAKSTNTLINSNDQKKKERGRGRSETKRLQFVVTGALNVKTVLADGMPTQFRRGAAWNDVMWFVEHMFLGHHERLPQCADLLRKPWRYIVEIPFIPLLAAETAATVTATAEAEATSHVATTTSSTTITLPSSTSDRFKHNIDFLFMGRVHLWAISRACAVRPWLMRELANRPRTVLIDLAEDLVYGPPLRDPIAQKMMHQSRFCLITRGDSYSTASFYNAIQAGCIPVVISDWFVFSFWWAIPYEKFVIRIPEELFVSNPNVVLDGLLLQYDDVIITTMQQEMKKWQSWLSYDGVGDGQVDYGGNVGGGDVTPLNLMLVEIKEASLELMQIDLQNQGNDKKKKKSKSDKKKPSTDIPDKSLELACFDPVFCASRHKKGAQVLTLPDSSDPAHNINMKNLFPYLCQHAPRLLGRYKIVYFQKCVKLLWPLRPGNVLKKDRKRKHGITPEEEAFIRVFHNLSSLSSSSSSSSSSSTFSSPVAPVYPVPWRVYPPIPEHARNFYHVVKSRDR